MIRSFAKLSLVALGLVSTLAIGCSNAPVDAETSSDEAALTSSASETAASYAGTFVVNGQSFTLEIDLRTATNVSATQTIWSTKWHADPVGRCGAYTDSVAGSVRVRVKDANGAILADDQQDARANVSTHLDDAECVDGFIANPRPITTLEAVIRRPGFALDLAGAQVSLPFGYGIIGRFAIPATANFTAAEELNYTVTDDGTHGYHSSSSNVRGSVSVVPASELTVMIGIGSLDFQNVRLEKR